ncbi:MAG: T9SS type A sorting domain-containing protein [Bacteroidetes bacterium]|nr:T9SS type A sorting domain-containing protein [Bacteroidota bacterium]
MKSKMKTSLLSILLGAFCLGAEAQTAIPNGNFENWDQTNFENPKYYFQTSNIQLLDRGLPFNCEKTTDAYHGSFAIRLTTVGDNSNQMFGYFVNTYQPEGDPTQWHGGMPFDQNPTGMRGYFKSNIAAGDTGLIFVAFSKGGTNIGFYGYQFTGQQSNYTSFEFAFNPPLSQTPDSMIFGATSSNALMNQMVVGSTLTLDSISLLGVSSQPAQLNGDFEEWTTTTVESVSKWYREGEWDTIPQKSTDAYKGSYALRLETGLGHDNGQPRAYARSLSTGYYPQNCNPCDQLGGYPFTNQTDTLVFWFKYVSAGGSKGALMYSVKNAGQVIGGNYIELPQSASYQKMEIPIYVSQVPDTLVVQFQSARWEDSIPSAVGSYLIVDEVQLKSAPLTTAVTTPQRAEINVYPNPSKGEIFFDAREIIPGSEMQIVFINSLGQMVQVTEWTEARQAIHLEGLPKGLYFYQVNSQGISVKTGSIVIE